jgi:class 3 adenylate cyclase
MVAEEGESIGNTRGPVALVSLVETSAADPSVIAVRLEGNERVVRARRRVASRAAELIRRHDGSAVIGAGESLAATFGDPAAALDYALEFHGDSGSRLIELRVGIHSDVVDHRTGCPYEHILALTRQLLQRGSESEVWTSSQFRTQIDQFGTERQQNLRWTMHPNCRLEGLEGRHILWSVADKPQVDSPGA